MRLSFLLPQLPSQDLSSRYVSSCWSIGLFLFCALLLNACSSEGTLPNADSRGGKIFTAQCARCHGSDARGGQGPSLRSDTLSAEIIEDALIEGPKSMPSFAKSLSEIDRGTITDFILELHALDKEEKEKTT